MSKQNYQRKLFIYISIMYAVFIGFQQITFNYLSWSYAPIGIIFSSLFLHHLAEAAHTVQHLFRRHFVFNFCTTRVLLMTDSAATLHWMHHKYLGSIKDPDYHIYGIKPKCKTEVFLHLMKVLFLWSSLKSKTFAPSPSDIIHPPQGKYVFQIVMCHSVIVCYCFLSMDIFSYFVFWIIPLGFAKVINDLRVFAEHFPKHTDDHVVTRNFDNTGLVENVFGGFGFVRHKDHHTTPNLTPDELVNLKNSSKNDKRKYLSTIMEIILSYPTLRVNR